jgi:hypothetical protein
MNSNDSDPTKAAELAQQIVKILSGEDSETRKRAVRAALASLGDASVEDTRVHSRQLDGPAANAAIDLGTFFSRQDNLRPSDNAHLCAAYHFALHGPIPFSLDDLRRTASEAGVVLPDRLDMTLSQATSKGRKLFQPVGKGTFRPTAAAGLVFKERWGVRPGRIAVSLEMRES